MRVPLLLLALLAAWPARAEELSRPVNLWPLVYRVELPGGSETDVLFSLISYKRLGRKTDLALRPFYWRLSDPERNIRRTDILWPLVMSDYRHGERTLRAVPLFFQKLTPSRSYSVFFPLYHYRSDQAVRRLAVLGVIPLSVFDFRSARDGATSSQRFLFWTHERSRAESGLTVFPLFATKRNRNTGWRRVSALGWSDTANLFQYSSDPAQSSRSGHALNYWFLRRGQDFRTVLFPLYWNSRFGADSTRMLWPLYGRLQRGSSVERAVLWPFFSRRADPAKLETETGALWPFGNHLRSGKRRAVRFFPLFAWSADPEGERPGDFHRAGMTLPVPLSYHASGKGWSGDRFVWLHWYSQSAEAERQVTLNYYRFSDRRQLSVRQGLFPLFHRTTRPEESFTAALPFYFSVRRQDSRIDLLPPFYWRFASSGTATTALFPLYLDRRSPDLSLRFFFPFYYRSIDAATGTDLAYYFPFYGRSTRDGRTVRRFLCFPLYARETDAARGESSLDILWPLFHAERSAAAAAYRFLPLYWHSRRPGSSARVLFPLYWSFRHGDTSHRYLLPLYGSYERGRELKARVFGPLYWDVERPEDGTRRIDVLLSLYSRSTEEGETRSRLFPFYWSKSTPELRSRLLPPLGGWAATTDGERDLFFLGVNTRFNLVDFHRSRVDEESSDRVLLYYRLRGKDESALMFVPLYFHWRDRSEAGDLLFPLFGKYTDLENGRWRAAIFGLWGGFSLIEFGGEPRDEWSVTRVLLYYSERDGRDRFSTFFPLYWRKSTPDSERRHLFPLFAYRREGGGAERSLGLLGVTPEWSLWNRTRNDEEMSVRFWPLFAARSDRKQQEGYAYVLGVHPKVSVVSRQTSGDSVDWRVLFRFIRWRRSPEETAFELNPLFFSIRRGDSRYWAVLGGLFGVETKPGGKRRLTYLWVF
ncbi:MAG: hypothetical protein A2X36_00215 [Elusimicrobia bacterium GWA2_69_24]|nr:MAG: hypothetical protein A2X36_00215 [Elusimicrobia bacterium GWA2_69_24]